MVSKKNFELRGMMWRKKNKRYLEFGQDEIRAQCIFFETMINIVSRILLILFLVNYFYLRPTLRVMLNLDMSSI